MGSIERQEYFTSGDKDEFDPAKWQSSSNNTPRREPETGLKVLIVGAGPAGLVTALECWRKGHTIAGILERNNGPVYAGDVIIIGPSALDTFRHWPDLRKELDHEDHVVNYRKHTGELILGPTTLGVDYDTEPVASPHQRRKNFFRTLLRQVARIGLRVEYGARVEKYFEREEDSLGGVVLANGDTWTADIVVAADAARTKSELLISPEGRAEPRSSGMSVYRTSYPTELALKNPAVQRRWGNRIEDTVHEFWPGSAMHLGLVVSPDFIAFGLTPRLNPGDKSPTESWIPNVDPEEVLEVLNRSFGWDEAIEGIIRSAPEASIIHWPLLWRNLRRKWISRSGRVVQVGDAAHTTVPASASGGTLAIEDAVTLAACLQLACGGADGMKGAALGTRTYNLLRYERISCAQKLAFVNAQVLGGQRQKGVEDDPEKVRLRLPKWLSQHKPEAYVYQNYRAASEHLTTGAEFKNTNLPPGHTFRPWTIEDIERDVANGAGLEDLLDGDWS